MKQVVLLIGILVAVTCSAQAKKIAGKIYFSKDTLEVVFNIPLKLIARTPDFVSLQRGVTYYNAEGKKVKVLPDHAKAFSFVFKDNVITMLSCRNEFEDLYIQPLLSFKERQKNIFLKLEINGKLKLFTYYESRQSYGAPMPANPAAPGGMFFAPGIAYTKTYSVLQKGNGHIEKPKAISFRKDMMYYFHDCPELVDRLKQREYTKSKLQELVLFYNSNCGQKFTSVSN